MVDTGFNSQKRRGIATIIGTFFFLVLMIGTFTALFGVFAYQADLINTQNSLASLDIKKANEKLRNVEGKYKNLSALYTKVAEELFKSKELAREGKSLEALGILNKISDEVENLNLEKDKALLQSILKTTTVGETRIIILDELRKIQKTERAMEELQTDVYIEIAKASAESRQ